MTKKERKEFMRKRVLQILKDKRSAAIQREMDCAPDSLLVGLKERMTSTGLLGYAIMIDQYRETRK
jgi:hypothetical protein